LRSLLFSFSCSMFSPLVCVCVCVCAGVFGVFVCVSCFVSLWLSFSLVFLPHTNQKTGTSRTQAAGMCPHFPSPSPPFPLHRAFPLGSFACTPRPPSISCNGKACSDIVINTPGYPPLSSRLWVGSRHSSPSSCNGGLLPLMLYDACFYWLGVPLIFASDVSLG